MTAPTQPTTQQQIDAVAQAQQAQLRAQLLAALVAIWGLTALTAPLPSPDSLFNLVRMMVPPYLGAQRAMVALVTNELQRQTNTVITPTTDANIGHNLRGVPVEQVLMRSFNEVNYQLDLGKSPDEAFALGQQRLEKTALTDLQLAKTHTVRDFATQLQDRNPTTVVGYRRVLSSNPNHCALCILASTRRYKSFNLMPIHPGCGCNVAMIVGEADPGAFLDDQRVVDLHATIERDLGKKYVAPGGKTSLAHYRDILVTETHGELGPVLAVRDHNFRGPSDIPSVGHIRVNPIPDVPNPPNN